MKEQEILENNKLIADFMGWKHHSEPAYDAHEMDNLKYHTSWDWLMQVVEKIEAMGFTVQVYDSCCSILGTHIFVDADEKKLAVYESVVNFIKKNKSPDS